MNKGVLIIYTGGTIGSRPRDVEDTESPQVVVPWEDVAKGMPEIERLATRFRIDHRSINPLDSCNVGPDEWREMASIIAKAHEEYEGFVVLHGTDTMVYSASALSFMLQNLKKPVIFTGAQRSALVDVRNDATQNLLTAIELANPAYYNRPQLPEVCVYFGGLLLRGNRAIKRDTSGYDAYESPNYPNLALVGDVVALNLDAILPVPSQAFRVRQGLETRVTTVHVYPGIQNTDLVRKQILETDGLRGVIVLGYGSGNLPTLWPEWLEVFREAAAKEIMIVEVSQCRRGPVELGIYETSALLVDYGFIACFDITLEAALTKMQVVLADPDLDFKEKLAEYQRSLAGEQSVSTHLTPISSEGQSLDKSHNFVRLPARAIEGLWQQPTDVRTAILRLRDVELKTEEKTDKGDPKQVVFHAYLNVANLDEASTSHPGYAGVYRKEPGGVGILTFDVTDAYRRNAKPGERVSVSLHLESTLASIRYGRAEFVLLVND